MGNEGNQIGQPTQPTDADGVTLGSIASTRAGTKFAPKIGAIMKHAPMRMNGHRYWASQASSCPVVIWSMGYPISPGMLSNSSRV